MAFIGGAMGLSIVEIKELSSQKRIFNGGYISVGNLH